MVQRRSFLRKASGTGIALTTPIVGQSAASIDITNHMNNAASTASNAVDSESNSDTTYDPSGYADTSTRFHSQGSSLKILYPIYYTPIAGWEARVGLTSSAIGAEEDPTGSGNLSSLSNLSETTFKFANSSDAANDFNLPDPEEGYRGFTNSASTSGLPTMPGWVETGFDLTVASIISLSASNPWTGVFAAAALSVDDILESLQKDSGKKRVNRGFKYTHVHKDSGLFGKSRESTDELSHYQRATVKMGETPWDGHVNVNASFGRGVTSNVSFEVNIGTCDGCGIIDKNASGYTTSNNGFVDMSNPTTSQKERFGIVSVSGGKVDDEDVRTKASLNRQVERIANSVEGREVTKVALNPPTEIKSTTPSRQGGQPESYDD